MVTEIGDECRRRSGDSVVFHFHPEAETCPICGERLKDDKTTRARELRTLRYGVVAFRETQMRCPIHRYRPEDGTPLIHGSTFLRSLGPPGSAIGYDVIVEIGKKRFLEFQQVEEIVDELERQHVLCLSSSSVSRWADFFLAAVECLHETRIDKLRMLIRQQGGYLLHIDATTESKSDTVFVCLDRVTGAVLLSQKMSSENRTQVEQALTVLKRHFGSPWAIMRDMSDPLGGAVKKVFPGKPDRICQFHFLRDIGKDLLGDLHVKLGRDLTGLKITSELRKLRRELNRCLSIDLVQRASGRMEDVSEVNSLAPSQFRDLEVVLALRLIDWIFDYARDGQGLGFPFDPLRLFYYTRLNRVRLRLARYRRDHPRTMQSSAWLGRLEQVLAHTTDPSLRAVVRELRSRNGSFQRLRSVLRFEITGNSPLAETMSMGTLKEVRAYNRGLIDFTKQLVAARDRGKITRSDQIILTHIEKYQFNLPIPEQLAEILSLADLDRTNNLEEGLFRDVKRGQRRQAGKKDISREFSQYGPYLPLMKNLTNEHYVAAVIGHIDDLPIRIGELDQRQVAYYRQKLQESRRGKFFEYLNQIDAFGILPHQ